MYLKALKIEEYIDLRKLKKIKREEKEKEKKQMNINTELEKQQLLDTLMNDLPF